MLVVRTVMVALCITFELTLCTGNAIPMFSSYNSIELKDDSNDDFRDFWSRIYSLIKQSRPTVDHFATHNLCKHLKKSFEDILIHKLRGVNVHFVKKFVNLMCSEKSKAVLKMWAAEIFDYNGDGYVTDGEKQKALHKHTNG